MTDEELNNLIGQTDLVSLISKYVSLEKKGKNFMGCCPFHNEKTPSFVVSPEKGMFNCFGCHTAGNALTFIKKIENIETKEAIKILCEFNGVEFKDNYSKKVDNSNSKYYKILNTAKDFYKLYLNQDKAGIKALEYLKKRGLSQDIIDKFEIGLSPKGGDIIHQVLLKQEFLELDCADMSLIDKNDKGYYDIFCGRIMFPIKDEMGNTLAFSARIFNNDDKNQPKYINSRETKIFHKGEVLFNLNLAKAYINKKHRVILHEGQMDVIASFRAGLGEAVCTMGTALSINQANMLRKYTDNVIICYDGDNAGINASIKAINVFKKAGFKIHLVLLPAKMDPDEYILKYGEDEYLKYFESHIIDEIEYQYQVLLMNKNFADKDVIESVRNDAFKLIAELNSNIVEEKYITRLANDLSVSIDAVKSDYNKYVNSHARINLPVEYNDPYSYQIEYQEPVNEKRNRGFKNLAELKIFLYAKQSKSLAKDIDKKIEDSLGILSKENQDLWFTLVNDYYIDFDEFDERLFIQKLSDEQYNNYIKLIEQLGNDPVGLNIDDLNDCINKINELGRKSELNNLDKSIKDASSLDEATMLLEKKFKKLNLENKRKQRKA